MSGTYIHGVYDLRIIAGIRNAAYNDKIMFAIEYNKLKTKLEHSEKTINMTNTNKDIINNIKNEMTVKYNNMIAFNAECDEIIKNCERVLSLS